MKREIVPFNDMFYVENVPLVWRFVRATSSGIILSNIDTLEQKTFNVNLVKKLQHLVIGNVPVGDVFDKIYELEETEEIPLPTEFKLLKELSPKIGMGECTPLQISKVLELYYFIMNVADDFEFADPYDELKEETETETK